MSYGVLKGVFGAILALQPAGMKLGYAMVAARLSYHAGPTKAGALTNAIAANGQSRVISDYARWSGLRQPEGRPELLGHHRYYGCASYCVQAS